MFSSTSFRCNFTIVNKSCLKSYFAKVCNIKSSQNGYNPNRHISSVSVNLGLILKRTQCYQHPGDFLYKNNYGLLSNLKASFIRFHTSTYIRVTKEVFENVPSKQLPVLKRSQRRKRQTLDESDKPSLELKTVMAYATAEEYDLERLKAGLIKQDLYKPVLLCSGDELKHTDVPDMLYAVASYQVDVQPREIFFFREGSVVFWNVTELECGTVLNFLRQYEQISYDERVVQEESEFMTYEPTQTSKCSHLQNGTMFLSDDAQSGLDKYTFSNALALSVKLGIWEASLDNYVDSIEYITDDLKKGIKINISQEDVLRKTGELFALRHHINLSSDLLDTPDFYWDHEQQEALYQQMCSYLSINRRTRVCYLDFLVAIE